MRDHTKKELYSWIKSIVFALVVAFICRQFLFSPITVKGESMEPTFENNDRIIVSKVSKIEHFDMIVFHSPISKDDYIKRVIGLPGDTIEMKNDVLYINGKAFEEQYLNENKGEIPLETTLTEDFKVTVPEGSLFVLGDNRPSSMDSRIIGSISDDAVVGEVKFRFYPFKEVGTPE
ncbi:signal peptidase I [Bacillus sp. CECT 9360]|uniref:signal peptidase I n=1 Tax=Bacillus sp. CECT 9360 TaxID=2845821 RepID=UPI001EF9C081|nr:signal peptidase I [Bacillus sp. CECT 9360]CAH0346680.1 Signal peptidase IB [Bacillus sp. CECT 9360]